jgi:hypothetical protein
MKTVRGAVICTAAVMLTVGAALAAAQFVDQSPFGFDRGQDVVPTFDGWVRNPDGTFTLYFGYLNRNAAEELYIPIGPNNTIDGGPDRGQPTYFYPSGTQDAAGLLDRDVTGRRRWWVFKIDVPKGWTERDKVVWTLSSRGKKGQATGWIQAEYEVTHDFIRENAADGHLFNRVDFEDGNRAPGVTGSGQLTVTLPETATIVLTATDDGRPKAGAPAAQGRKPTQGVRVRWITYRGPTRVRFEPETIGPFPENPAKLETKASFSTPGTYRLRAIASDGQLFSTHDIDVVVNPGPATRTAR